MVLDVAAQLIDLCPPCSLSLLEEASLVLVLMTVAVSLQTCYSMHSLAKLVHLDITSNNVMIADNPQGRLRLIDFGFSQITPSGEAVLETPDNIAGFRCRFAA